jgi:hypothetical protein
VIWGQGRTEGAVFGSALHGEYVHYTGTGEVYNVREHLGGGFYDLLRVGRDEHVTANLNTPGWTFHPAPDMVVMTARDTRGNVHTYRMSGLPAFADEELNTRRLYKRHWLKYGVPHALVTIEPDWYWTSRERLDAAA